MRSLKIITCLLLGMNLVTCCSQKQEPRRPISQSSGEFIKSSVERNKKLNQIEEDLISDIIEKDTAQDYIASQKGYWYFYNIKNDLDSIKPVKGDVVNFNYDIKNLKGQVIYTESDLKTQQYVVDKQSIMTGLRDGIKLMKKGEKVTFLFPSHMAFGYHGDNRKIGTNEPLICTVTLTNIKSENATKTTLN